MGYVRKASMEDVEYLAPRLKEADRREIVAATGLPVKQILELGLMMSDECFVMVSKDDIPGGIFGVHGLPEDQTIGVPWMVTSDLLRTEGIQFLRECSTWIERLQGNYQMLLNYVDKRHTVAIRWLKWCGFRFTREITEFGYAKIPFIEFVRYRNV